MFLLHVCLTLQSTSTYFFPARCTYKVIKSKKICVWSTLVFAEMCLGNKHSLNNYANHTIGHNKMYNITELYRQAAVSHYWCHNGKENVFMS